MPIIFSTIPTLIPASQPDQARVFFQAPDDALLASVVAEVASILGRHQAYVFHEPSEVPAGRAPVVLNLSSGIPPLRQPISLEQVQRLRDATGAGGDRALALMRTQEIRRRSGKAA